MNLIIFGPPGSGKGTQADVICQNPSIKHLSTGNIFRENIKNNTELGTLAKKYMDKGELVPDSVTIKMFENEITKEKYKNGFLLDGFPRTVNQANELINLFNKLSIKLNAVINLSISDELIIERISNRLTCPICGEVYHRLNKKPKVDMLCDNDQTPLIVREDDSKEVVQNRLNVYREQTEPVLEYFKKVNLNIITVDSNNSVDIVNQKIMEQLNG